MSNSTVDQLFSVVTSIGQSRDARQAPVDDGGKFQAHLDRAAETTESKPTEKNNDTKATPVEDDAPLDSPESEHEEASASDQQQPAASAATAEQSSEPDEREDTAPDEVTLSTAAVQQLSEAITADQQTTEPVVESSLTGDQQQSQEQSPEQNPAQVNGDAAVEAEANVADSLLQAETNTDKAANLADNGEPALQVKTNAATAESGATTEQPTERLSPSAPKAASSVDTSGNANTEANAANAIKPLPESEPSEKERYTVKPKFETFATSASKATSELTLTAETDTPVTNLTESVEVTPSTSTSTNQLTNNQVSVLAGRPLNNVLAGKSSSASSSAPEPQNTQTPTVDRARFVQRVGGAIRSAQNRDGNIQLRLSPPELGTLRIQLTVKEGAVTAQLETDNAAARTVLLDNLPALRERLAEQEIRIEKFDVDVGREGQQETDHPEAEERQNGRPQLPSNEPTAESPLPQPGTAEAKPQPLEPTTGLDVRI